MTTRPTRTAMATPEMSDTTSDGIRVGATAYFLPERSEPDERRFVFGYTIVIANVGERAAQLVSRRWIIIDAAGRREQVEGPGVVGQTPKLAPGEAFKYQSFCPLKTDWGTMEGAYQMVRDDGEAFEAKIDRFFLRTDQAMMLPDEDDD
ncbi:MAG TPA: Co2+/Mg2+ efflux protein ApaG [Tepidisphaeraceae bacterium]|nr:Co2+/Mg2+ efflux protein ApaG [Tepidisphaeraceae bacterium]